MRIWKSALGAIAATSLLFGTAQAQAPTALDAYVAKPDPAFDWKVAKTLSGPGYRGALLELTSQTWLSKDAVDRPVWRHWLTVVVPTEVKHDKALLFIGGGDVDDPAPAKPADRTVQIALETNSVVADLGGVPNQPLRFAETADKARWEDDLLAYQQAKYAKTRDPNQIVRLPMVKSAHAAMTAVQQYLASEAGGRVAVKQFVVAGGSKRGWTTWLTGATDPRVVAIMPIVIDVLNTDAQMRHHWEALGYFSPALQDYVNHGLVPQMVGSPQMNEVRRLEDPYYYLDRAALKMPKYVINASGDEFFLPDSSQFYWDKVQEEKRLRYLPNSKHNTVGTDIVESMIAFYGSVLTNTPRPAYGWRREGDTLVVTSQAKPQAVTLWRAVNPKARDFRLDSIGKAFQATPLTPDADGAYRVTLAAPSEGYAAQFVELAYPSGTKHPFKFTTEVFVTPNRLPYDFKNAKPITSPAD